MVRAGYFTVGANDVERVSNRFPGRTARRSADARLTSVFPTLAGFSAFQACKFYDAVLGPAGQQRVMDVGRGHVSIARCMFLASISRETAPQMYGGAAGLTMLVVSPYNKEAAAPGNGPMAALAFDTRKEVEEAHARALANAPARA